MKKFLTIIFTLLSVAGMAQFPNTHTQSNPQTKEVFNGAVNPKKGLINGRYADTATANLDYIAKEPGGQIIVGNTIYVRDVTATKWIAAGTSSASTVSILNDSSIIICNSSSCDTFKFTNIVVNNFSIVNDSTILVCDGNNVCDTLFIPPTPIAKTFVDSTIIRGGDSLYYYINGRPYFGGTITATAQSTVSIANDSTLVICNSVGCDTFHFQNIIINNFSVLNDSTILVCDGNNTCDTLHIAPTQIAKSYVDSVKIEGGGLVYYYVNGNAVLAGVLGSTGDGLISGGQVIWSGQGLKFYVSPATYIINQKFYSSPLDSVTLDSSSTFSRVDLFIVDTTSHAGKITGIADGNLLTPQVDLSSQIALTTGIQINPGDTIPANVTVKSIYDENLGVPNEWSTHIQGDINSDFASNLFPEHGLKNIFTNSYTNNSRFYFLSPSYDIITSDEVLTAWIRLSTPLGSNDIYISLYDQGTGAYTETKLNTFRGFNPNLIGEYQLVSIPLFSPTWINFSGKWSELEFIFKGPGGSTGISVDNITIQKGINNLPIPGDYSNKPDSVTIKKITFGKDTANIPYNWFKGVGYPKGDTVWTSSTGTGIDSLAYRSGSAPDTGMFKLSSFKASTVFQIHVVTDSTDSGTGTGSSGNGIQSVTGLNTDNTDPINPVVKISVDGTTITGDGTPANPLVSHPTGTSGGSTNSNIGSGYRLAVPLTNNIKTIFSVSPILVDSVTNSNALTFKFDTSVVHTTAYNNTLYGSVADLASKADKVTTLTINGISYDLSTNRTWTISSSGGSADVKQVYTGTSSVTVTDSTITWLVINPSSISSSMTITTPAIPKDKQKIEISFGGTITSGVVVSNLIIAANSGQSILQSSSPSTIMAGETISYRFNATNNIWYRVN